MNILSLKPEREKCFASRWTCGFYSRWVRVNVLCWGSCCGQTAISTMPVRLSPDNHCTRQCPCVTVSLRVTMSCMSVLITSAWLNPWTTSNAQDGSTENVAKHIPIPSPTSNLSGIGWEEGGVHAIPRTIYRIPRK